MPVYDISGENFLFCIWLRLVDLTVVARVVYATCAIMLLISVRASLSATKGGRSAQVLLSEEISTPDGLALDWVHKNLYWADTGKNTIEVVSVTNPRWRQVLISTDLDEPRAIVVDPRPSQMYVFFFICCNCRLLVMKLLFCKFYRR